MEFEAFKNTIMDLVSKEVEDRGLEGISMKLTTVESPDGMTDRLMVSVDDSKMSMAFRLKEIYQSVEDGEDIDHAVFKMVNTIEDNISFVKEKEQDVKSFISDYEKVKDNTYLRLIPGDSPILKSTPHRMIEDMALVVNVHLDSFSDEHGKSCVVVTKPLMEMYGIDETQLFADAEKNSLANEPIVFKPLLDMVKDLISKDEIPNPEDVGIVTYIATNQSGFQGAAVAGYPDFCEKAAEAIGGSFYMLPSSVHEFILIKDDGTPKAKDLNRMIKNVNETVLEPRDVLAAQCYHYDAKAKVLETGLNYAQRTQQRKGGAR
ncbi:MAG: hypothetical protein IKH20_11605 [Clostridiales bacterium]|nr:hypothetical protein [Clostridiales bacterium]